MRGNKTSPAEEHLAAAAVAVPEIPLRMAVDAQYVGAIIGQGGANIRAIVKETRARCMVDVKNAVSDQFGNSEKIINIFGSPENCTKACVKILEIIQKHSEKERTDKENEGDLELRMRTPSQLVGRLIGKGGSCVKKIMEDTGCKINISNNDVPAKLPLFDGGNRTASNFYPPMGQGGPGEYGLERTISIRGSSLEKLAKAEESVFAKLRESWQKDFAIISSSLVANYHDGMYSPYSQAAYYPHDPYLFSMMPPVGPTAAMMPGGFPGPMPHGRSPDAKPTTEVVHMWIPNHVIGSLIGTKGSHIREIMRVTGAHIRVEQETSPTGNESENFQSDQQGKADIHGSPDSNRLITVSGTDMQQYRAQFEIFNHVKHQCGIDFHDEAMLCTEVKIPTKLVGRVIGKSGANVRELQRISGAQIHIPDTNVDQSKADGVVVQIFGGFAASQTVQARIRHLINQEFRYESRGYAGASGGPRGRGAQRSRSADTQPAATGTADVAAEDEVTTTAEVS